MSEKQHTQPWARIAILLASLAGLALTARLTTGQFIPSEEKAVLIFQNALLLIVLGSALLEHQFTKPAYAAINGLMGSLTLLPVYGAPNRLGWWIVFGYCAFVCVIAITCVAVSEGKNVNGCRRKVANLTPRPPTHLHPSRFLFTFVFPIS